ncbi:DMT family transporter [Solihabitans fulvus]|nr:DMT family transporter [Solihabitans fulvus]
MTSSTGRGWLPGFLALSAIWGASFLLIKIAVDAGVPPAWVALCRCLFGALTLWLVCAAQRASMPRDPRVWLHVAVVAVLLNSVPFTLLPLGETMVSSVVAGTWNAATPLSTLVFALLLLPGEHPNRARLVGLATGFLGVLVVLRVWDGAGGGLAGGAACFAATVCYGAGFAYTRRFLSGRGESATVLSTMQITCAAVQLALVVPALSGLPKWPGFGAAGALLLLGAAGTGFAYIMNFQVIRAAGPTVAATVTYVSPLWSTALGVLILAEPVGWPVVVGGVLILAGVVLSRGGVPAFGRAKRVDIA